LTLVDTNSDYLYNIGFGDQRYNSYILLRGQTTTGGEQSWATAIISSGSSDFGVGGAESDPGFEFLKPINTAEILSCDPLL
jgi:hypothetical protein